MHKIISGLTCEYRGIYTFPANVSCFSKFSLACTLFILYCLVGLVNCFIIFHLLVFSMLSLLFILNSWVSKSSLASRPTAFSRLKGSPCTDICVCLRMVSTLLLSLPPPSSPPILLFCNQPSSLVQYGISVELLLVRFSLEHFCDGV